MQSVKNITSRGRLYNILPYENELTGFKINGRKVKKVLNKNNYFTYHYNSDKDVILVEEMVDDLGAYYFTMYFYYENVIEKMYWQKDILSNVTHYNFKNGFLKGKKYWALYGKGYNTYKYKNNKIVKIFEQTKEHTDNEISSFDFFLQYDENESLLNIVQSYPNGYSRMIYPKRVEDYQL